MATYIAIDEDYCLQKLTGIRGVVDFSKEYRHRSGQPITFKSASDEFKNNMHLNVYAFDNETLNGLLTGKIDPCNRQIPGWKHKIQRI